MSASRVEKSEGSSLEAELPPLLEDAGVESRAAFAPFLWRTGEVAKVRA